MTSEASNPPARPASLRPSRWSWREYILVAGLAVHTALLFYGATNVRYMLTNIDGISYVSIARHYAEGHLDAAVNAYWSPLFSWLTVPFLAAGVPDAVAMGLVSAFAAATVVIVGTVTAWRWTGGRFLPAALYLAVAGAFALGNLPMQTPDMLVAAWIVVFAAALIELTPRVLRGGRRDLIVAAAVLGVLGALGYVTKLFLIPVFVVSLVFWLVLVAVVRGEGTGRQRLRRAAVALGGAALVAVVLSAPWVTALSIKYEGFTIGTSLAVNVEHKFEPPEDEDAPRDYILWAPPNEYAVSFGEDRSPQAGGSSGSSDVSLVDRLVYYGTERLTAFPYYVTKIGSIAPFAVATVVLFLVAVLVRGMTAFRRIPELTLAIIWVVYFLGYAMITSASSGGGNARYYWPLLVVATLLLSLLLPAIWDRVAQWPRRKAALAILVVLLAFVPVAAVWQHGLGRAAPFSTLPANASIGYLLRAPGPSGMERLAHDDLAAHIAPGSKLVSSNYRVGVRLSYYLGAHVYGRADQGYDPTDPIFQQLLRDTGIDYYLLFTPVGEVPLDLSGVGPLVSTIETRSTCDDTKTAPVVDCRIDIIRVAG